MHLHDLPDERELDHERAELAAVDDLVDRELALLTLRRRLAGFRAEYLRTVGTSYATLDDVCARMAEARAARQADDESAQEAARDARQRADATAAQVQERAPLEQGPRLEPTAPLRTLYLKIARNLHPDLAPTNEERLLRRPWMARLNDAYWKQDVDALKTLRAEWEARSEPVPGSEVVDALARAWLFGELTTDDYADRAGIACELARVNRKTAHAKQRVDAIGPMIDSLKVEKLYNLYAQYRTLLKADRNLLDEMSARLDVQIAYAQWEGGPRQNVGPPEMCAARDLPARGLGDLERWQRSRGRARTPSDARTTAQAGNDFEFNEEQWGRLRPQLDRCFRAVQRERNPGQDLLREFIGKVKHALGNDGRLPKHVVRAAVKRWIRETRGGRDVAPAQTRTDRSGSGAAGSSTAGGTDAD